VVLSGLLWACGGGDDGQKTPADAYVQVIEHNLACLNHKPASVPMTIRLDSVVDDFTLPNMPTPVANATMAVTSLDGTTMIDTQTSDMDGKFTFTLTTNGTPTPFRYAYDIAGFPKTRLFVSTGPTTDVVDPMRALFLVAAQSHIDGIATALQTTLDPTKGGVEILMFDCSNGDYAGATPVIAEEPGLKWAMLGGAGAWVPRTTTIHHPNYRGESVAGAVNLTPGMKSFTLVDGTTTIGPVTFRVEADTFSYVVVYPGYPLN
jgi:hypothetical protein